MIARPVPHSEPCDLVNVTEQRSANLRDWVSEAVQRQQLCYMREPARD